MTTTIGARQARNNIYVAEDLAYPEFFNAVLSDLARLEETSIGRRLIKKIESTTQKIFIQYREREHLRIGESDHPHVCENVFLLYYPGHGDSPYFTSDLTIAHKPSCANLAHELIHAYHYAKKNDASDRGRADGIVWTRDEEYHTIMGFPSKREGRTIPKVTENALLAEMGLPERFSHLVPCEKIDPLFHKRTELAANIYKTKCQEIGYAGQRHNPPPPVINCSRKDLGLCTRLTLLYLLMQKDISQSSTFVDVSCFLDKFPDDFVGAQIPPEECPVEWQLQNFLPDKDHSQVHSMGIYALSPLEALELDKKIARSLTKNRELSQDHSDTDAGTDQILREEKT